MNDIKMVTYKLRCPKFINLLLKSFLCLRYDWLSNQTSSNNLRHRQLICVLCCYKRRPMNIPHNVVDIQNSEFDVNIASSAYGSLSKQNCKQFKVTSVLNTQTNYCTYIAGWKLHYQMTDLNAIPYAIWSEM